MGLVQPGPKIHRNASSRHVLSSERAPHIRIKKFSDQDNKGKNLFMGSKRGSATKIEWRNDCQLQFNLDLNLNHIRLARVRICGRNSSTEIAAHAKESSPYHWKFCKVHTGSRCLCRFPNSVHLWLYNKIMQTPSKSHSKSWKWNCSQYWARQSKARHSKYKRLQLGGGHVYAQSSA
jgi:hypothetical protein